MAGEAWRKGDAEEKPHSRRVREAGAEGSRAEDLEDDLRAELGVEGFAGADAGAPL